MANVIATDSCPICGSRLTEAFRAAVLHRYTASFDYCADCGLVRARDPYWLAEAYADAISLTDTGLLVRNRSAARQLTALCAFLGGDAEEKYLDFAGGYGVLTRMMRDNGFDFYWSDKYCTNLLASGFEYDDQLGPCRAVTAFEVMEHVEDPRAFVGEALAAGQADTLVFTTELYAGAPPRPEDWWYYSLETGQHISFYRRDTLHRLAAMLGMNFHSSHGIHIFSRRELSTPGLILRLGRLSHVFAWAARRRRTGKTWADHQAMAAKLAQTAGRDRPKASAA